MKKVGSARDVKAKSKHLTFQEPEKCETKLMIPSLSVGANYTSDDQITSVGKKGSFSLEVELSSTPSETIVTPHLMDYLEQAIEPVETGKGNVVLMPSVELSPPKVCRTFF